MIQEVEPILREAGTIAHNYWGALNSADVEFKGSVDLVTKADKEIEDFLRQRLLSEFPGTEFFGEEGDYGALDQMAKVFIADPLDGTTNFVHRHPFYSISVGYREHGTTRFGAVYLPEFDALYHAELGRGAYLNGQPIHVSKAATLIDSLASTGFACVRQRVKPNNLPLFEEAILRIRGIRRCGSAAADLCYVAEGRYDLFWEYNLSPWDIAAGVLIVSEAGGRVSDFTGGNDFERQRQLAASNGAVHSEFLEIATGYR